MAILRFYNINFPIPHPSFFSFFAAQYSYFTVLTRLKIDYEQEVGKNFMLAHI